MTKKKTSRLTREILEMADDQQRLGLMDAAFPDQTPKPEIDLIHERLKRLKERLR